MGACKYCGKDAGWFSSSHRECEEKHENGVKDFTNVVNAYFTQRASASDVQRSKSRLAVDAFLSEDDICNVAGAEIRRYTDSIHRPFSPASMKLMDEFLIAVGVSYAKINRNGAVDDFTKKIMRGFMVEYFTDQLTLQTAHFRCEKLLTRFPMDQSNIDDAYLYVLDKAATNFTKNGMISDDDQLKIDQYVSYLHLPVSNLPARYQGGEISKLGQMSILRSLQRGVVPPSSYTPPVMLGKGETLLWTYNGVTMYEEKIEKQYQGRRGGFSFRVMKGVTYHTGGTRLKPVEYSYMDKKGVGTLYVTNKHIIFQGSTAAQKVAYAKMIGVTPYSDGIEVHRDGANAKRLTFQGFDSWFLMNVLSLINNL